MLLSPRTAFRVIALIWAPEKTEISAVVMAWIWVELRAAICFELSAEMSSVVRDAIVDVERTAICEGVRDEMMDVIGAP